MAYSNKCKQWTLSKTLVIYVLGCSLRCIGMTHLLFVFVHRSSSFVFISIEYYFYYFIMCLVIDVYWCTSIMLFSCIILLLFITNNLFKWQLEDDKVVSNCIVWLWGQYTCNIVVSIFGRIQYNMSHIWKLRNIIAGIKHWLN